MYAEAFPQGKAWYTEGDNSEVLEANMVTKEIIDDKVLYMDLLLLADEQEDMIHRYHALLQCTDHSHCFSTSFSLFKSSGLAICSFMPVFFASCTSSAKAFAVMAMMGTLPRLPARARIAAVAS